MPSMGSSFVSGGGVAGGISQADQRSLLTSPDANVVPRGGAQMTVTVDLTALLSADNAVRGEMEKNLETAQAEAPARLSMQLVTTLASADADPTARTMAAVLLRRRLPAMLPALTGEWCDAVKAGLLEALASPCDDALRRKTCDAVGRLGAELHADGSWPQLLNFVHGACTAGEPKAHEAALTVLGHMAPALVEPASWATVGAPLQALLLGALAPTLAPGVTGAALSAAAAMLSSCAGLEGGLEDAVARKKVKAVAASLAGALPMMLGALEQAVNSADTTRITQVLESLSEVASTQPRLYKPVLPQVVDGMCGLSSMPQLPSECRIACIELLLTLAEGAPKMMAKNDGFGGKLLSVLVPMMVRLNPDTAEWEAGEPDDGLRESDEDDDAEKEPAYAGEALDRLCEAIGGEEVTGLLLPQVQGMLSPDSPWAYKHGALVAIGTVCEHGAVVLEPHLGGLVELLRSCASAAEPRLRWAALYCMALLADEFSQMAEAMHATVVPMAVAAAADAAPRVQAAGCLAMVNLVGGMLEDDLRTYQGPILTAVHAVLADGGSAGYVAYAAACALVTTCTGLADAAGAPMGGAYAAFMPLLTGRLMPAMAARSTRLASALLSAIGGLAAAAGAAHVAADAPSLVSSVTSLLERPEVSEDRELVRAVHTTLSQLAGVVGAPFVPAFEALMPPLLAAASVEVEFHLDRVEVEEKANADDGWEVSYMQNGGKGLVRLRVNATQMDEKLLGLEALYSYASALGIHFMPAVAPLVAACLPILNYRFSDKVRSAAANALCESYKCVAAGAADASSPTTAANAAELLGALFKPMSEQLLKEDSLEAADAMLDAFREIVEIERTHKVGAFGQVQISGLLQIVKHQLQADEKRAKAKLTVDDDEADEPADDEADLEAELLTTVCAIINELLRQHGASALSAIEAQLLPHVSPWLSGADPTRLALGIEIICMAVGHAGQQAGKKYVQAVLPLLLQHCDAGSDQPLLRRAAAYGLGVVCEHGGKLLSRKGETEAVAKLAAVLGHPSAKYSANVEASEAAAAALGKAMVFRAASAAPSAVLPAWLPWLPLRHSDADARDAMGCLCKLLEADAAALLGGGDAFPQILCAMAGAYEADASDDGLSARIGALVKGWGDADGAKLQAGAAALPHDYLKERVARMAA